MLLVLALTTLLAFLTLALFSRHFNRVIYFFIIFELSILLGFLGTNHISAVSGEGLTTPLAGWTASGLFDVPWVFAQDSLTYTMFIVVLTVSTLVHFYSTEYMKEDPHLSRFVSYLSLFTFFMLVLITSDNFVGLFLGWEGVGLCSFLLISFWFTRIQANKAAIKAMVVNRVSDLAFLIGIMALYYTFRSVDFSTVFSTVDAFVNTTILFGPLAVSPITLIAFLLFVGAMGKSAQIGLHTWLPDAMEGPTPVSALIHAATMVTAGVFLIIRSSPLFECTPTMLLVVAIVGAATAFMAATSGLLQNDLKKVIAYSTCSQLGYMTFICGLSGYSISLFHLANHAFFKALLFLGAGAVIHSIVNEQDMRQFGATLRLLPFTYVMFVLGSLALMGFPFLTGFYSKDLILEVAVSTASISGIFTYWLGLITAFFTAFYSFRLIQLAFYGPSRTPRAFAVQTHELSGRMAAVLIVLAFGSLFLGYMAKDLFIGFGTTFWNGVIQQGVYSSDAQVTGEFLHVGVKLAPLFGSIIAVTLVLALYRVGLRPSAELYRSETIRTLHRFFSHKWYFDTVYNRFINLPLLQGAYNIPFSLVDKGLLEVAGPTGAGQAGFRLGSRLAAVQTGRVYDYAAFMLFVLALFLLVSDFMS